MSKERQERLRKILLKKQILTDRRNLETFLKDKTSFNEYFKNEIKKHADLVAVDDTYNKIHLTYKELEEQIEDFASGLQFLGVNKGDFVDIFTENQGRWCICYHGVLRCGAVGTLRGSSAPKEELDYIIGHSDAVGVILRDGKTLELLKPYLNNHRLKFVIIMLPNKNKDDLSGLNIPVYNFEDVIELGKKNDFIAPEQMLEDNCLMLYTSGTTGNPKGVILTHKNIISQYPCVDDGFQSKAGEETLQILPVWHAYEHTAQNYYLMHGCHLHFTTLSGLKNDLVKYDIATLMSVPRIWEAMRLGIFQKLKQKSHFIYRLFDFAVKLSINYKIHKMYSERRITNQQSAYHFYMNLYHKFIRSFLKPFHILFTNTLYKTIKDSAGINFRASISGGGALSMKDQLFYDAIGVNLREGYGLTETSPVLALRGVNMPNFLGSCGRPIPTTEIKIVDPETKEELGIFKKGLVMARGYQIMKGYYKDENATKAVLDENGWFNTGDIGWLTGDNNLVLVGRLKETIVLSNGENVEPVPIEDACIGSPYIEQIMLVGQDEVSIGALVVPSEAALQKCGILAKDLKSGSNLEIKDQTLRDLIKKEIATYIKNKPSLKPFEQIKQFEVLKEGFNMTNGLLTQSAKIKRNNVFEKYRSIIKTMFEKK